MSKVTDYATISGAQADDLLMVVDVHDMTQSSAGSTKKMTLSQVSGGLGLGSLAVQDTPAAQVQSVAAITGNFTTPANIVLLNVAFAAPARLRLYNSSADRTADQARPAGTNPSVGGLLYEYNADALNVDYSPLNLAVGGGLTVYWQLDNGTSATVTWVRQITT